MTKITTNTMSEATIEIQAAITMSNFSRETTSVEDRASIASGNLIFNARKALKEAEATRRAVVVTNNMLKIYDGDISADQYNKVFGFVLSILYNGNETTDINNEWNILRSWNKEFIVNVKTNRIFVLVVNKPIVNIA